jgi:predicted ribosomally synthesized peptide with SipW-like signal peptide
MKKKILLSSIAVIALCLCLIAGSTYALFTETTSVNIAVTAGDLNVAATIVERSMMLRSLGDAEGTFERTEFANGGDAEFVDGRLVINKMTPGDGLCFEVEVENTGDIAAMYTVDWATNGIHTAEDLFDVLEITVLDVNANEFTGTTQYSALGAPGETTTFLVIVEFTNGTPDRDNQYQGAAADIQFTVTAVQGNGVDENGDLILP